MARRGRAPDAGGGPLYRQIANRIAGLIEAGTLRAGDRVPSLRQTSAQQRVSLSTSLQAYGLLESRGLVEARPQSGFYVRPRLDVPAPDPERVRVPAARTHVDLASALETLLRASQDPTLVGLGAAAPSPELLPERSLARLIGPILRRKAGHDAYSTAPGLFALRREIARRAIDWGGLLSPDDVVTTCGGTEALYLALRAVTRPGDTVAVESPAYFGTLLLLQNLGLTAVEVPTLPGAGISVDGLRQALAKHRLAACIATFNCHNPLGFVTGDEATRQIVELLARHEVPLIEDEVYGELQFSETPARPAKAFDRAGLVLLCASFSKVIAPGYRVGWIAAGRYHRKVLELKFTTTLATPTLPQLAIAAFLRGGAFDRHIRQMRIACRARVERMREAIGGHFPPGTRVTKPAGGFLLWVELPGEVDALRLFDEALDEGISITPGPAFSARLRFRNCIRLNCAHPWSERIEWALAVLGRLVRAQGRRSA
jgi:DNA-binding transcriptional MocR family regulator